MALGEIKLKEVSNTALGKAAAGHSRRPAYLLLHAGSATDLLDKGHRDRTKSAEARNFFERLVTRFGGVSVVVHFCRGQVHLEEVSPTSTEKITFCQFLQDWPRLTEDVRYVVQIDAWTQPT